ISFVGVSEEKISAAGVLGDEVHRLEKILTEELACSLTEPPEICRAVILFPAHLERIGDYLESILNCCKIRCRDAIPFTEKAVTEIDAMFGSLLDNMKNFRDAFIRPNKVLLEYVTSECKKLDQKCQDLQLVHVEDLLNGSTAPRSSSLYLDILESSQSLNRHLESMASSMLTLVIQHSS
ncbi:MAG: hypothetical protein QG577_1812, partial [Thermodesulfobacteriota bacterium]|nr:hypothetical protein [Thermodesulfobacteriota bacterium]